MVSLGNILHIKIIIKLLMNGAKTTINLHAQFFKSTPKYEMYLNLNYISYIIFQHN